MSKVTEIGGMVSSRCQPFSSIARRLPQRRSEAAEAATTTPVSAADQKQVGGVSGAHGAIFVRGDSSSGV